MIALHILNEAAALHRAGNLDAAAERYRSVLEAVPGEPNALRLLGVIELQRGNLEQAARLLMRSLKRHRHADGYYFLGRVFLAQGSPAKAIRELERCLALDARHLNGVICLGLALQQRGDVAAALLRFDRAIEIDPSSFDAWRNRALALGRLGRRGEALESWTRALSLRPDWASGHAQKGHILGECGHYAEAAVCYARALEFDPSLVEAWEGRGMALQKLGRHAEAIECFRQTFALDPNRKYIAGNIIHSRQHLCDWDGLEEEIERTLRAVREGFPAAHPFHLLAMPGATAVDQRDAAVLHVADVCPPAAVPLHRGRRHRHDRIRVGYVSGEFGQHATSHLLAGVLEAHDRSCMEVIGLSTGMNDRSPLRARIEAACDRFVDVSESATEEIAGLVQRSEIDILVNLSGHTGTHRNGVFALRPAPLQVNWLGYPGTFGAPYVDYIIADDHVIADESAYTEKIVYLPHSYQANTAREIAGEVPVRAELGLPQDGFVFCCFNATYKITPDVFGVWMRLLKQVDGSVLWLLAAEAAADSLRRNAAQLGVDPARLVFAQRMPLPEHLARHRRADVFLDTLPCNAHTTASDALWAGLPVITCKGETFASRVGASLLAAVGLDELITGSLDEYERLALTLARDNGKLAGIKARLAQNLPQCPLFDTAEFARSLERAFVLMHERHQAGQPPATLRV
jgi:predicted O-linked N-acetylglucosamine transferase (SPINDLY family)